MDRSRYHPESCSPGRNADPEAVVDHGPTHPPAAERRPLRGLGAHRVEPSVSIVGINYSPEITGIGVYSSGMAEFLAEAGHRVVVHTGFPYYPQWGKSRSDRRTRFREQWSKGVRVRRNYLYVPSRPTVLKRIAHELSFVLSASLSYLLAPRTDVTIIVSPPLLLGLPVALIAALKRSKVIFHVQDLQPDAAVELGMMRRGWVTRTLYAIERWTYRLADTVSAISPGMLRRVESKGVPPGKLLLFRNWADDTVVVPQSRDSSYRVAWGLWNRFVVLYSGNLGVKQGLDNLLDAAELLQHRDDIVFVVVGDGGERDALMALAQRRALGNVVFRPLQPLKSLSELLATADVAVVPQKRAVSDIVLPSKINNLLASARPIVVAADPGTDLHRLVTEAQCGLAFVPGDATALTAAVLALYESPQMRKRMGGNGRRVVDTMLSRDVILGQFDAWLRGWAGGASAGVPHAARQSGVLVPPSQGRDIGEEPSGAPEIYADPVEAREASEGASV